MSGSGGRPTALHVSTDDRFGRLTVINPETRKPGRGGKTYRAAECRCDCGNTTLARIPELLSGRVISCGCARYDGLARHPRGEVPPMLRSWVGSPEQLAVASRALTDWHATPEGQANLARNQQSPARLTAVTRHGLSRHPLYQTWRNMMVRCYDSRHPSFAFYGGRGITVCAPWHDVRVFIAWIDANLGPRPAGTTLDRYPDNNGNYEPGNVRWATRKQQAANRRARSH